MRRKVNVATPSKEPPRGTDPFQNMPLPGIADEDEHHVLDHKTLLECWRCARPSIRKIVCPWQHWPGSRESPWVRQHDS